VTKNIRYEHHYDKLIDNRVLEQVAKRGPLQCLTDAELELNRLPVTIDPDPDPVRAWVRFGPHAVLVDAFAERWTERAVGIRFTVGEVEMKTWVYMGAVRSVGQKPPQGDRRPGMIR
jgi:hypothetical protein